MLAVLVPQVLMKGDDDRGRVLHGLAFKNPRGLGQGAPYGHGLQQVRGRQCEQLGISCRGQSGCVVPLARDTG